MEPGTPRDERRRRRVSLRGRDAAVPASPASPVDPAVDGLHVCPTCRSALVQPLEWHDAGPHHWLLERFCPECWWTDEDRFEQGVMEAFDVALDDGTDALMRALHKLAAERMQDDIERFTAALYADAVLPEDF